MKDITRLNNEEGSVLIVALVILVLLTLLGIFATKTSEIEIQIAGNDMRYKRNLYSAEAVAMECAQNLKDTDVLDTGALSWLHSMGVVNHDVVVDDSFWDDTNSKITESTETGKENFRYMAAVEGIADQTSLDMTKSRVHAYSVYGRWQDASNPNEGRSIINMGYKKAF